MISQSVRPAMNVASSSDFDAIDETSSEAFDDSQQVVVSWVKYDGASLSQQRFYRSRNSHV